MKNPLALGRFLAVVWVAAFGWLFVFQVARGGWMWAFGNSLLVAIGVWVYCESVIETLTKKK